MRILKNAYQNCLHNMYRLDKTLNDWDDITDMIDSRNDDLKVNTTISEYYDPYKTLSRSDMHWFKTALSQVELFDEDDEFMDIINPDNTINFDNYFSKKEILENRRKVSENAHKCKMLQEKIIKLNPMVDLETFSRNLLNELERYKL